MTLPAYWNGEGLKRRLPVFLIAAGAALVVAALLRLSLGGQDALAGRRPAGWAVAIGMSLLMSGITARQNAKLDRRQSVTWKPAEAAGDRAAPTLGGSSSLDRRAPAWQLWRHW